MDLARQVFGTLCKRVIARRPTIARIIREERCSFEEWLNWEFFDAVRDEPAWTCTPRPPYSKKDERARGLGDLLVEDAQEGVFCEIAVVHNNTSWKWVSKIEGDGWKLNQLRRVDRLHTLQIVVVATKEREPWRGHDGNWKSFMKDIGWDVAKNDQVKPPKPIHGEEFGLEMRGWLDYRTPRRAEGVRSLA